MASYFSCLTSDLLQTKRTWTIRSREISNPARREVGGEGGELCLLSCPSINHPTNTGSCFSTGNLRKFIQIQYDNNVLKMQTLIEQRTVLNPVFEQHQNFKFFLSSASYLALVLTSSFGASHDLIILSQIEIAKKVLNFPTNYKRFAVKCWRQGGRSHQDCIINNNSKKAIQTL